MTNWYIGTMGFGYADWRGSFYPEGLSRQDQLGYYASRFNALEMDSTFYGTPKEQNVVKWHDQTPAGFRFCPKMPRTLTHDLRLRGVADLLNEFLRAMRLFGDRLGSIAVQFPPDFAFDEHDNLAQFLAMLPGDMRFAVELRHRSWWREETAELLRAHNTCWIAADYIYLPKQIRLTTDFLYIRFLGRHGQFAVKSHEQIDRTLDLEQWQERVVPLLKEVSDVYAFFNDDYSGHSPATAGRFMRLLGLHIGDERPPQQGRLF